MTAMILVLFIFATSGGADVTNWGYRDDAKNEIGPKEWSTLAVTCNGSRQSPIPIDSNKTVKDSTFVPLQYDSYNYGPADDTWIIVNTGKTVHFTGKFSLEKPPIIFGGGLGAVYVFSYFQFHWGSTSKFGSEHTLDGNRYPLELQIVHRKVSGSELIAGTDPTGYVIISVLFELVDDSKIPYTQIQTAVRGVQFVNEPGAQVNVSINDLNLAKLLPTSQAYYRYLGSLTQPPCSETVVWIVMKKPLAVAEGQLNIFRALRLTKDQTGQADDDHLLDNYRPLQNVNKRVVTFSREAVEQPGRASVTADDSDDNEAHTIRIGIQFYTLLAFALYAVEIFW